MTNTFAHGIIASAITASLALAHGPGGPGGPGDEDKPTTLSNLLDSIEVSFKPGSGITFDGGDRFRLRLKNRIQAKYSYYAMDSDLGMPLSRDLNSFRIRRARTDLSGHVWEKNIQYKLQVDSADGNGVDIKDAWVHWNFVSEEDSTVGLRFGQTKTQFGREATGTSAGLEFVERSVAARTFSDARARGAMVMGAHLPNNEAGGNKLFWSAGVFNSDSAARFTNAGEENANDDDEVAVNGTIRFDPFGDIAHGKGLESYKQGDLEQTEDLLLSVGAGIYIDNYTNTTGNGAGDVEATNININAAVKIQGFHGLGEIFLRTDDPDGGTEEDTTGWNVAGSYTLPAEEGDTLQWGFAGRISQVSTDNTNSFLVGGVGGGLTGDILEFTGGLNAYYHEHDLKTQLNYTYQNLDPDVGSADFKNHLFELMFTLVF